MSFLMANPVPLPFDHETHFPLEMDHRLYIQSLEQQFIQRHGMELVDSSAEGSSTPERLHPEPVVDRAESSFCVSQNSESMEPAATTGAGGEEQEQDSNLRWDAAGVTAAKEAESSGCEGNKATPKRKAKTSKKESAKRKRKSSKDVQASDRDNNPLVELDPHSSLFPVNDLGALINSYETNISAYLQTPQNDILNRDSNCGFRQPEGTDVPNQSTELVTEL